MEFKEALDSICKWMKLQEEMNIAFGKSISYLESKQIGDKTKSAWVNIYKYGRIEGGFKSEEEANAYNDSLPNVTINPRVACIEIHWEEI